MTTTPDYNKLERAALDKIGAKAQPNSGRGKHKKGDGILNDYWVVDVKNVGKTFGVSEKVWAKVCTDSMKVDPMKSPMLYLVIGEGQQKVRLAVIEMSELEHLMENYVPRKD